MTHDNCSLKKAYKAAIEKLVCDSSSNEDDDTSIYHDASASPRANVAVEEESDPDVSSSDNSVSAHAACMFSSLK